MKKYFTKIICISAIFGMALLAYILKKITGQGIYADETDSSGHIAISEIVIFLVALMIVISSIILIYHALKQDIHTKSNGINKIQNNFKNRTLLSLVLSAGSLLLFYLTPVAIIFGIWAISTSYHRDSVDWRNVLIYRIAIVFAALISVINFVIVFTTK